MRYVVFSFVSLVTYVALSAPTAAAQPLSPIRGIVVASSSGGTDLEVHNESDHDVTALIVTARLRNEVGTVSETKTYLDALQQSAFRGIQPRGVLRLPLARKGVFAEPSIKAAVFGDGQTFGDAQWVARIQRYREADLAIMNDIINRLSVTLQGRTSTDDLIQQCKMTVTLSKNQRIVLHGDRDLDGDIARYTKIRTEALYTMIIQAAERPASAISSQQGLSALSRIMLEKRDRLAGIIHPQQ